MRRLLALILLGASCLAFAEGPKETVQRLIHLLNQKDFESVAKLIKGGQLSPGAKSVLERPGSPWPAFGLSNPSEAIHGNSATVNLDVSVLGEGEPKPPSHRETVTLNKVATGWLIVPPAQRPKGDQVVTAIAYLLGNPNALAQLKGSAIATSCLANVKQVALCCLMMSNDNDDVLKLDPSSLRSKLMPYSSNEGIFTCPSDKPGTISYTFNANLSGIALTTVRKPSDTILICEGQNGKLNFRHEGRAAVAFCDGHCRLVTKEQAKNLIWKL